MAGDGYKLVAATSTTFAVMMVAALLRFYVRFTRIQSFGWDDWTMFLTVCVNIVGASFNLLSVHYGFGQHAGLLTLAQIEEARKWSQLAELINIVGVWIVKVSICCFLLRIISSTRRGLSIFLYILITINTMVNAALFITWFLQSSMSPTGVVAVAYLSACFNMATDVMCALLPVLFLAGIQISLKRKLSLLCLTTLGLLTCVASILKIVFLREVIISTDVTYSSLAVTICAQIEQNMSAFLANLPPIKVLFTDVYNAVTTPKGSQVTSTGNSSDLEYYTTTESEEIKRMDTGYSSDSKDTSFAESPTFPMRPLNANPFQNKDSIEDFHTWTRRRDLESRDGNV